jgi:hypothetical protein
MGVVVKGRRPGLLHRGQLADMILEPGPLGEDEVQAIATKLARALPAK